MTQKTIEPTPRPEIFDLYWYYAYERYSMFKKRLEGLPAPWTDDPILAHFKFCNTLRFTDRVSQDLLRRIANHPLSPKDDIFRTVLYRFFSNPATFTHLEVKLGQRLCLKDLETDVLIEILDDYASVGNTMYTNAFILCASKTFGHTKKHYNHIDLFRFMFLEQDAAAQILALSDMKSLTDYLQEFPMIGPFMAYQIANDLCFLDCVAIDPNTHTIAGPGALRGIAKAFSSRGTYSPEQIISMMYKNQDKEFQERGYKFVGLSGQRLGLVDCQGLFCELDKYCRVARPDLISTRTRIKNVHTTSPLPVTCILPQKWA